MIFGMNYLNISNRSKISTIHRHLSNMFYHVITRSMSCDFLHVFSIIFIRDLLMNKSLMLLRNNLSLFYIFKNQQINSLKKSKDIKLFTNIFTRVCLLSGSRDYVIYEISQKRDIMIYVSKKNNQIYLYFLYCNS